MRAKTPIEQQLQSLTSPSAWPTCAQCRGSSPSAWLALLSTRPYHPRLRTKTKRNSLLIMESNSSPYLHMCYLFSFYSHRECVDSREEISLAHHDVLTEKMQNMSGDWSLAQMHFHLEWWCKSNLNCMISIFCDSRTEIDDFTPSPLVFTSLIVRLLKQSLHFTLILYMQCNWDYQLFVVLLVEISNIWLLWLLRLLDHHR